MPETPLVDDVGRRRSPVTLPGYLSGRSRHNKGMRHPALPPRVDGSAAGSRHTSSAMRTRVELAREGVTVSIIQRQLGHYARDRVK